MAERSQASIQCGLVVWEKRELRCQCRSVSPDRIEISLTIRGVVVDRKVFTDAGAATAFAIDKMHAYNAPY